MTSSEMPLLGEVIVPNPFSAVKKSRFATRPFRRFMWDSNEVHMTNGKWTMTDGKRQEEFNGSPQLSLFFVQKVTCE